VTAQEVREAAADEPVVEAPNMLSDRLEVLAKQRSSGTPLRGALEAAVDDAIELEGDLARSEQNLAAARTAGEAHRVAREQLEADLVVLTEANEDLRRHLDEHEAEVEGAKLEAATLAAEVQRLEAECTPLGQRRAAWEAAAGERTQADTFEAVLAAAQWIAGGARDGS